MFPRVYIKVRKIREVLKSDWLFEFCQWHMNQNEKNIEKMLDKMGKKASL